MINSYSEDGADSIRQIVEQYELLGSPSLKIGGNKEQLTYEINQGYIQCIIPYLKDYDNICKQ